ncbi:uncharacterized protein LOC134007901 isoform X1 [Osmerus eperlanus]|uniref:uncharacterized protein LOC134007901 isoform X1 n=1 Tax=Osmerus eperlanus TaxID=29151 RepID=UPI002E132668
MSVGVSWTTAPEERDTADMMEEGRVMVMKEEKKEEDEEEVVKEEEVENEEQIDEETEKRTEDSQDSTGQNKRSWEPYIFSLKDKETYHFLGLDITIYESLHHIGCVLWPGSNNNLGCLQALALCEYLETNREQINLMDKYVLELGAGTGLVSIVAALLGSWVTATDLPEILGNLRFNLMKNTRGRCRYTPQVAELTWGDDLDCTYPKSIYRYDYIMASDVVYNPQTLDDLLVTMKHFCQPGTKLIWANKVRLPSDLTFTEKFQKAFHTTLVAEVEDIKICMAMAREEESESHLPGGVRETEEQEGEVTDDETSVCEDEEGSDEGKDQEVKIRDERKAKEECHLELSHVEDGEKDHEGLDRKDQENKAVYQKEKFEEKQCFDEDGMEDRKVDVAEDEVSGGGNDVLIKRKSDKEEPPLEKQEVWKILEEEDEEDEGSRQSWEEQTWDHDDEGYQDDERENTDSQCSIVATDEDIIEVPVDTKKTSVQVPPWAQCPVVKFGKDVYTYVGQEIGIFESQVELYGAVMWPAALALCHYLETNSQEFNMMDKTVLELGAGTGLVSIVASLLGASVTATDISEIMRNMRLNLMRNTEGRCRHTPQTAELFWGHDLEVSFPKSFHRYDYVLAADVVYHHKFLKELLATMKYFCQPGTKLIWANKVRLPPDLDFAEDFKNTFHTTQLADLGGVKLFLATSRE